MINRENVNHSLINPKNKIAPESWIISIVNLLNENCFFIVIEGIKKYYNSNGHFQFYEYFSKNYQIITEKAQSSFKIIKIEAPQQTLSDSEIKNLPSASMHIAPSLAEEIMSFLEKIQQQLLASPNNCPSYDLPSDIFQSVCLANLEDSDPIDNEYLAHRNDRYLSFAEILNDCKEILFLFGYSYRIVQPTYSSDIQMNNMFQPYKNIWEDITNVMKPYASQEETNIDLLQPLYGVMHLLLGVGGFFWGMTTFFFLLLVGCIELDANLFKQHAAYPLSWMVEGVGNVLYGGLQILTSPFLYFIKWPIRNSKPFSPHAEETDTKERVMTTVAILKKIKHNLNDPNANQQTIHQDCHTVCNLLTEIDLGPEKFNYQLSSYGSSYTNPNYQSSFFKNAEKTQNITQSAVAQELIKQSIKHAKNIPDMTLWMRANQILCNKPLPSLQDIEEVGCYLDTLIHNNKL